MTCHLEQGTGAFTPIPCFSQQVVQRLIKLRIVKWEIRPQKALWHQPLAV